MKIVIPFIFALILSASPVAADLDDDVANFAAGANNMGQTTAILRACGYGEKADAFHAMVMEQIISLISTHQEMVPVISNNYDQGISDFRAVSAGQGAPPSELCAELISMVAEYGL